MPIKVTVMLKSQLDNLRARKQISGVTLIEMIVTIVILGIAMVGVAVMVRQGIQQSANTLVETRAVALGNAYLDEIMGRRFDERSARSGLNPCFGLAGGRPCSLEVNFGPDGGESRPRFDDVDDYHGLAEGDGEATPLQDGEGVDRDGYENYKVEVNVQYAGDDLLLGGALDETHAKLITVTVTSRDQNQGWDLSVYRTNY